MSRSKQPKLDEDEQLGHLLNTKDHYRSEYLLIEGNGMFYYQECAIMFEYPDYTALVAMRLQVEPNAKVMAARRLLSTPLTIGDFHRPTRGKQALVLAADAVEYAEKKERSTRLRRVF